jgi:N-acetylglutamate synthase-like GNAT family acetyltransferase
MEKLRIINTSSSNIHEFGMCGYKNIKQEGYRKKIEWLKQRYQEGLRYQVLFSEQEGAVGAIEYIPGEYAWRPVDATGYMFIHCIIIIPKKYKEKGYGTMLLETCIEDARQDNMKGVVVVTRKGTWMAGKELFVKNNFKQADSYPPDFELMVMKFDEQASSPCFRIFPEEKMKKYNHGLWIFTSDQCPITEKAVREITETAKEVHKIKTNVVELKTYKDAQDCPSAFGTFCMIYNGEVIADHPVSNTRFKNIINRKNEFQQ